MDRLERVARAFRRHLFGTDGGWESHIELAQIAIDAMQDWRPADTAPEDTEVLVYRPDGIQKRDVMMRVDDYWYWPDGESPTTHPTHWLPLPESPK